MKRYLFFVALATLLACGTLQAKITLPSVIGDNMVLQQQTDAALWGKAEPGRKVTVKTSWNKKTVRTTADPQTGQWLVRVATPAAGGPYEITISDGEKITLKNILVGEVWFASGQSNMEMPVMGFPGQPAEGGAEAIVSARRDRPIRVCNVQKQSTVEVMEDVPCKWEENTPGAVAATSAAAWFFADAVQTALGVPVGIIHSSWGGSNIETWIPYEVLKEQFPEVDLGSVEGTHPVKSANHDGCLLFNGMVAPLLPYTIKGILWYQGEANRGAPAQYIRLQTAYVQAMRERFQVPDAPFYFVQIAPWPYGGPQSFDSGYFFEAQQKSLETIPHSGMAVTCDIGDYGTIHPPKKREVGQRLAWLALEHDYGFDAIKADAPTYAGVTFQDGKAVVTFNVDNLCLAPIGTPLEGFEIAGEDRVFHKADAMIDGGNYKRVVVSCAEVPAPVAVRYCFRNWCKGNLYNTYGVPAAPFRTDNW